MGSSLPLFIFNVAMGRIPDPSSSTNFIIQNFMQAVGLVVAAIPEGFSFHFHHNISNL